MSELAKQRNELWDTLVALFGTPAASQQRLYGKVVKELGEIDATPDGMIDSAMSIAAEWGRKAVTPTSLLKWYTRNQGLIAQLPDDPAEVRMAIRFNEFEKRYAQEGLLDDTQ